MRYQFGRVPAFEGLVNLGCVIVKLVVVISVFCVRVCTCDILVQLPSRPMVIV